MESLIVHCKNQMELNALKSVMKDMGIKYEKFHTRNAKTNPNFDEKKPSKTAKSPRIYKDKPKNDL